MSIRATIIIAVHNDPRLEQCLSALSSQTFDKCSMEVVVIENGSETMRSVCEKYCVCYLNLQEKNLAAARNLGLQNAHGEFILITDADCVPSEDWVEKMIGHMDQDPACKHAGGRIKTFTPITAVQRYGSPLVDGQQSLCFLYHIAPFPYIATANAIFDRKVLLSVGGFDSDLLSGSDVDISYKFFLRGHSPTICETAFVLHQERTTIKQYLLRFYRYSYYHVLLFKKYKSVTGRYVMINAYPVKCMLTAIRILFNGIPMLIKGERGPIWRSFLLAIEGGGVLIGNVIGAFHFRVPYL